MSKKRTFAEANRAIIEAKERRQTLFIAALPSVGYDLKKACSKAGVTYNTLLNWKKDRRFADVYHQTLAGGSASPDEVLAVEKGDPSAFPMWRTKYLGRNSDPGHTRISDAITAAKKGRITIILAAPECGKSSTLEDYMTFRIAADPNVRITYVHQSATFAKDVVGLIQTRFTDHEQFPQLIERYGPFKGSGEWSSSGFVHAQKTSDERGATLRGRGIFSKAQGIRADLLLIDDIQDIESIGQTARLFKILRQTYFTRGVKDARLIMVGNRVDVGDVWEAILEEPGLRDLVDLVLIPAMEDGVSLFPSIYTSDEWANKRIIVGDDVWYRNYMQSPRRADNATFREDDLKRCLSTRARPHTTEAEAGWRVATSVDPALAGQAAVITCAWNETTLRVVDVTTKRGLARFEELYDILRDHTARYDPQEVIFEDQALQKGLARDERIEAMAREEGFVIREHVTSGKKFDPRIGVGAMASSFIRADIEIPMDLEAGDRPHHVFEPLWDELLVWRSDVPTRLLQQDCVMALWFNWLRWREQVRHLGVEEDHWTAKSMPSVAPRLRGRVTIRG